MMDAIQLALEALKQIAQLDYKNAATNCAGFRAVGIANNAINAILTATLQPSDKAAECAKCHDTGYYQEQVGDPGSRQWVDYQCVLCDAPKAAESEGFGTDLKKPIGDRTAPDGTVAAIATTDGSHVINTASRSADDKATECSDDPTAVPSKADFRRDYGNAYIAHLNTINPEYVEQAWLGYCRGWQSHAHSKSPALAQNTRSRFEEWAIKEALCYRQASERLFWIEPSDESTAWTAWQEATKIARGDK